MGDLINESVSYIGGHQQALDDLDDLALWSPHLRAKSLSIRAGLWSKYSCTCTLVSNQKRQKKDTCAGNGWELRGTTQAQQHVFII